MIVKQTLEELLMPLAERLLPPELGEGLLRRYDPRFDALRDLTLPGLRWHLDISMGASVRAMGACGAYLRYLGQVAGGDWECEMHRDSPSAGGPGPIATGVTPELAMAGCLVALVEAQDKEAK